MNVFPKYPFLSSDGREMFLSYKYRKIQLSVDDSSVFEITPIFEYLRNGEEQEKKTIFKHKIFKQEIYIKDNIDSS